MIKFFKKIRLNILSREETGNPSNRAGRYLKYAMGEIVLVVIGILIALQINNWNNNRKDRKLEKQYLIGLIEDLRSDSTAINSLQIQSDEQVRRKEKLFEYFDGQPFPKDSIAYYFEMQWGLAFSFVPNTAMLDEMKSTGGISLIEQQELRKKIIEMYNSYEEFINGDQAYYEHNRFELRKMVFKIPYMFGNESLTNTIEPDIEAALKNDELRNGVLANYAISVNEELKALQSENRQLLLLLTAYLSELNN